MNESTSETEARYKVVTLLYTGKIQEAESALDNFVRNGTISEKNEAFYRSLVAEASRHAAELDASFHEIPTSCQAKSHPSELNASQV
jgi:transcription termination factor NusB